MDRTDLEPVPIDIEEESSENTLNVTKEKSNQDNIMKNASDNAETSTVSKELEITKPALYENTNQSATNIAEDLESDHANSMEEQMQTPKKLSVSFAENMPDVDVTVPANYKRPGVSISTMNFGMSSSPKKKFLNKLDTEQLVSASPSVLEKGQCCHDNCVSLKLDVCQLQQTVAELKLETDRKLKEITKMYTESDEMKANYLAEIYHLHTLLSEFEKKVENSEVAYNALNEKYKQALKALLGMLANELIFKARLDYLETQKKELIRKLIELVRSKLSKE